MKNSKIIATICLLVLGMTLLSTALLVTQIILGYSGFPQINGKTNLVSIQNTCSDSYLIVKYAQPLQIHFKVSFIATVLLFIFAMTCLMIMLYYVYNCVQLNRRRASDQTAIQQQQSYFNFGSEVSQNYYQSKIQIASIYLCLALCSLFSYLPFNNYLQILIESKTAKCQINHNTRQLIPITLLSLLIFAFAIVSFIFELVVNYRFNKRQKMIELQNGSESYRQQVNRIIRQIPQSERRFFENRERQQVIRRQQSKRSDNYDERSNGQKNSFNFRSDRQAKASVNVQNLHRVESIIYKADPQLMLQSVSHQ